MTLATPALSGPVFVLALAAITACGAPPEPAASPATTGSSAAPAKSGVPEGGACGDDVAIQKTCAEGLVCKPKPGAPVSEHTPGVCTKK